MRFERQVAAVAQVVGEAQDDADADEAVIVRLHGGGEDEELPDEARREGNAREGEHGHEQPEGEEGRALGEAVEVGDIVAAGMFGNDDKDEEAEEGHQQIAEEVIGHGHTR